ncbi:unnamed protein product [Vitrella brassicaformis CCMP3155]|uniref:Fe2OG dioxygenase domain-containing protein n=2 Tax=Vitrella brassicaformis TaxID=1169539 RepID=A0A0G4EX62_VITBC|nr:unnamed protein product [Vitrella brassicaformis CCMP3155]|eukprot:CEM03592.1 unnamed protein product [Vitrella brassicaformis CCMP3155]
MVLILWVLVHLASSAGANMEIIHPRPFEVIRDVPGLGRHVPIVVRLERGLSVPHGAHLEVAVRSGGYSDIWLYDVPPTPHKSVHKHAFCPTRSDASECRAKAQRPAADRHPTQQVVIDDSIILKQGFHELTFRLVTPAGVPLTERQTHILLTPRHTDDEQGGSPPLPSSHLRSLAKHRQWKEAHHRSEEEAALEDKKALIAAQYQPLHEQLRHFDYERDISADLRGALSSGSNEAVMAALQPVEGASDVYYIPEVLTPTFRRLITEELSHAYQQQSGQLNFTRPNTMNNYGFVLEELGMREWLDGLMTSVVRPLASAAFPDWGGSSLDSHHAFTIAYSAKEDIHLDKHMDLSEVTLNICLGDETFTGGKVYFKGQRDHPHEKDEKARQPSVAHLPGGALLHVGQHWHGAHPLESGRRQNLVFWARSSKFRSSPAETFLVAFRDAHNGHSDHDGFGALDEGMRPGEGDGGQKGSKDEL